MGRYSEIRESRGTDTNTTTPSSKSFGSTNTLLSYSCSNTVRTLRKMSCFEGGKYGSAADEDESDNESSGFNSSAPLTANSKKAYSTNSLPRGLLAGGNRRSTTGGTTSTTSSSSSTSSATSLFDIVSPEEISYQLTLIDSELFRQIQLDELISCGWTSRNKDVLAPNVLAFTRRFNHVSFWVVEEVLNGTEPRERAVLISYFIRLSKKLYELNNLHSLFAIVSALRSASIYRLSRTWELVGKKDRTTLQKFVDLFSDRDNWSKLRESLDSLRLPCVPYIGVYLTDLVYLGLASRSGGSLDQNVGANNIFRIVTTYQAGSSYSHLPRDYNLQAKLRSVRYIDELLKFVEDYNYKKSLSLEPPPPPNTPTPNLHPTSLQEQKDKEPSSPPQESPTKTPPKKFIPGHKKSHSWIPRIPWIKKTV